MNGMLQLTNSTSGLYSKGMKNEQDKEIKITNSLANVKTKDIDLFNLIQIR